MGEKTGIKWTDGTANFWWGCQRVSPGCEHCYAEHLAVTRRKLKVWGPPKTTARQRMKGVWADVVKWNAEAAEAGARKRVFVSSMADVFEDHPDVAPWRAEALALLATLTSLDVQLLTKRPGNVRAMVPPAWLAPGGWPAHVWIGTTVEDQKRADERIPELLKVPAPVRFLSCEPLLEALDLAPWLFVDGEPDHCGDCGRGERAIIGEGFVRCANCGASESAYVNAISWVIVGGESGPGARPFDLAWARSVVAQCREAGVACFVKQMGDNPVGGCGSNPCGNCTDGSCFKVRLKAHHGADPSEWPADLRIQQFPETPGVRP